MYTVNALLVRQRVIDSLMHMHACMYITTPQSTQHTDAAGAAGDEASAGGETGQEEEVSERGRAHACNMNSVNSFG